MRNQRGNVSNIATAAPTTRGNVSRVLRNQEAETVVDKEEYLMEVNGNSARFTQAKGSNGLITALATLAGNVGLSSSFPWLSKIAPAFENYAVRALEYIFKPSCPTSTAGTVSIVPTYDPTREAPSEKTEIMSQTGTVTTNAWNAAHAPQDPKLMDTQHPWFKVRTSENAQNIDLKTTDFGKTHIYLEGDAATTAGGV